METLILDQQTVRRLLPMTACIDVMEQALGALARGEGVQPLRSGLRLPGRRGLLGVMPAYYAPASAPGIKVITVFPGNHGTRYDSHQGVVLLFEGEHGCLRAVMDASEITAIRTAAVSGLATRLLAREDARRLAILGSGVQAFTHVAAVREVRPIEEVRVWSRDPERGRGFAERIGERFGLRASASASAREVVAGADVVCTTTASSEPIVAGDWLAPGVHINAVGASLPNARELDTAAVAGSTLFVDRRESALAEAGDVILPIKEGAIDAEHIRAELGEVILGQAAGRGTAEERTLFKSLGLGIEDVAAAQYLYQCATAEGAGVRVELGGERMGYTG